MTRALLALLVLALFPATASAGPVVSVSGASGPGPARYDRVSYERFGPASAKRVLILVPGFQGGAGDFSLVGPEIVRHVKGLQVWAYDRRSQAFEDHTGFATGDPDRAFGYYLQGEAVGGKTFAPVDGASVPYVRDWGLKLALEDLRQVVKRARRGGRKVILGGHSLGASMAVAYAAWDFGGRAGHRDLSGLVLIDGGLLGSFTTPQLAGVKQRLAALQTSDPFADLLDLHVPWAAGVLSGTAGMYARLRPDARATLTDFPLIPPSLRAPVPATNEGGARLRVRPHDLARRSPLIQVRAGRLATTGDPVSRILFRKPAPTSRGAYPSWRHLWSSTRGVHPLRKSVLQRRWIAGSSPAMTEEIFSSRPRPETGTCRRFARHAGRGLRRRWKRSPQLSG